MRIVSRSGIALPVIGILALSNVALAHEGDHGPGGGGSSSDSTDDVSTTKDAPPVGSEKLSFGLDWVMGFGNVLAVEQQYPGSTQITPTNVIVSAPYRTQTYMPTAHYAFSSFGLGLRVPMTIGNIRNASPQLTGDNVFTVGGIALAIDMPKKVSDTLTVTPELELVAPTAQGDAPPTPEALAKIPPGSFDRYAAYKYSANLASAMSHGYEDDALFWAHRAGAVPRIGATLKTGALTLAPFAKLPIMVDTHTDSDERLRLEVVAGARLAYAVTPWFEPGVRVWVVVPIIAQSGFRDPAGVVEPQLRFHAGNTLSVTIAGILPFAGGLTDPYTGAIRATVGVAF